MEIKQDLTPVNFTPNGMKEVRGLVIHSMWGTYAGSIAWFKNPDAKASAHYCISKDGEITQTVLDKDMAWHAGYYDEPVPDWVLPNPNYYCIGIEFEDNKDVNWPYPQVQKDAGAWLVALLMKKYNIAKDHVMLHKELNPSRRSDPVGQFSRDWLFAQLGDPTVETDYDRGIKFLNEYRTTRAQGPEGNYEGFVRAVVGNDMDAPSKENTIKELQDSLGKTKTDLTNQITALQTEKETLNTSWQTKLDIVNKKLENMPTYVLNLTPVNVLFGAFISALFKTSKTKEQLDQELGLKGVDA